MLGRYGMATGRYDGHADDGVCLGNVRITNAVRCVPPQNKPTGYEAGRCRPFLQGEIGAMNNLKYILALGRLAHEAVLRCLDLRIADYPFAHASSYDLGPVSNRPVRLISSYHCSRYNTQTGRLTDAMFSQVFDMITER